MKRPLLIIFLVLLIDQSVKFWIKLNYEFGTEFSVLGDWFRIHFTENNGMAFGLELEHEYGKLILSLFRILAVGGIGYYLWRLVKEGAPKGLIASIALILAGALGNILDSAFYGLLFSESKYDEVASFLPESGGYASFLHGKVVDMLYFPLVEGYYPEWFPESWAGDRYEFFRPVFNIADSAITVGVAMIILFQRKYFVKPEKPVEATVEVATEPVQEAASDAPAATATSTEPTPSEEPAEPANPKEKPAEGKEL